MGAVDYKVPFARGTDEFVEKKSRFIGNIMRVTSPEEAMEFVAEITKMHKDANHNAYAYILSGGAVARYSDNGEPQGTAGIPIMEVLKKEEIFDVICVATRYFGGILLGAGGLTRAYSRAARVALAAAGVGVMRPFQFAKITADYHFEQSLRRLFLECDAEEISRDYGEKVELEICTSRDNYDCLVEKIVNLTSGKATVEKLSEKLFVKKE